jgi:hypothetical protein
MLGHCARTDGDVGLSDRGSAIQSHQIAPGR